MSHGSGAAKLKISSTKVKPRFVNPICPGRLDLEFIFESIRGLSSRGDGAEWSVESERGIIAETFAGVCLAVPKDEAATQEALRLVGELEVQAVRIDLSESNVKEAVFPLL